MLKFETPPRLPLDGRKVELEFINTVRTDDGNVIRFSSPESTLRDGACRAADSPDRESVSDPKSAQLRQLYENSPAAIVLLDTYDHVIDLNPAFTKMFLYTFEEIKNLPLTDFIVPKGHMREAIEMTLKTLRGEPILQTIRRKRKDGTLVDVELTAFPIKLQGNRIGIYTIYADVSQKTMREQRIIECEKLGNLGQLAGSTAREINAVIGMLMAAIRQLSHGAAENAAGTRTMQELNAAVDRGAELVRRLLAFAGKAEVDPETRNAEVMMQELYAMLQSIVPEELHPKTRCGSAHAALH